MIAGFAGSTADALTLFERLESKLEKHAGNLSRAVLNWQKIGELINTFEGWKP